MKNGRKKLTYGTSPEDALEILSYRLPKEKMAQSLPDWYERISQKDLHKDIDELG